MLTCKSRARGLIVIKNGRFRDTLKYYKFAAKLGNFVENFWDFAVM